MLLPEDRFESQLRSARDAPRRLFLLRRIQLFQSAPSDLAGFGMAINHGNYLQPTTVKLLQTSPRLASYEERGYGLGWYVDTVTLTGKQTRVIGHDGDSLGGMIASLTTFPEYGIVVAVTANISYADTFAVMQK
ncbi:MAG TPA: serine hydrolase [Bryobacteraceae bacterium]|nr:serine hydrolase [Bryobacteraceae bacterium]